MARPSKLDEERTYAPRLSITITTEQRKKFRLAAALGNQEVGQWGAGVLERAADLAVKQMKGGRG